MWWRVMVGILLLALLGGGGWLAYGRFFRTFTITRIMTPGEQWTYTITHTIQLDMQRASLSYQVIDTVKRLELDGSALVERVLKADNATMNLLQRGGGPLGAVASKSLWRCTPDGRETPLQPPNAELFLATASRDVYPARPVRHGQEWSIDSETGSLKTRTVNRFEGVQEVNGVPCYKITTRIESLPGSLPQAEGRMTTYIDRRRGWVRRIEARMEFRGGSLIAEVEFIAVGEPTSTPAPAVSSGSAISQ
ncbi:MAG: hypothetical protein NZL85_04120 [Fimbriimonadales bacterium]|nr:hypothetical protein [Fimbriimonadales bacterium]